MGVVVTNHVAAVVLHAGDVRAPEAVFERIFTVFLVLGALVGVVVITYTLYNAYAYREGSGNGDKADVDRPEPGELPTSGGGGKKLFLSFGISAIIVLSLIGWTYTALLDIEHGPADQQAQENALEVRVEGYQFGWRFIYPNGEANSTLTVPVDRVVMLNATSTDVFHNFGIPELRVKTDAIPGQNTRAWFVAHETGTYQAQCYELCGSGHSYMTADVRVVEQDRFQSWYDGNASDGGEAA